MPPSSSTTIKVQKNLRERISRVAAAEGRTAAGLISQLLDEHERQARFASVRNAYATADADTNEAYVNEAADWDSLADDGLVPDGPAADSADRG